MAASRRACFWGFGAGAKYSSMVVCLTVMVRRLEMCLFDVRCVVLQSFDRDIDVLCMRRSYVCRVILRSVETSFAGDIFLSRDFRQHENFQQQRRQHTEAMQYIKVLCQPPTIISSHTLDIWTPHCWQLIEHQPEKLSFLSLGYPSFTSSLK